MKTILVIALLAMLLFTACTASIIPYRGSVAIVFSDNPTSTSVFQTSTPQPTSTPAPVIECPSGMFCEVHPDFVDDLLAQTRDTAIDPQGEIISVPPQIIAEILALPAPEHETVCYILPPVDANMNIRSRADESSAVVVNGGLPKGTIVTVLEEVARTETPSKKYDWFKVDAVGQVGYVASVGVECY